MGPAGYANLPFKGVQRIVALGANLADLAVITVKKVLDEVLVMRRLTHDGTPLPQQDRGALG